MGCVGGVSIIERVGRFRRMRTPLIKNITPLPRTWSEAKRDADYACWIEVPKREWDDMIEFGMGMLFVLPLLGLVIYLLWVVLSRV